MLPGVHDPLVVTERRQGADHRRGLHEVGPGPEHVRDGCVHRILSVHLDPLPSAAVTTSISPRAFTLAADQPAAAAAALQRLPDTDPARPVLAARLAWREGRLTDAIRALEGAHGRKARRLHATLAPQQSHLAASPGDQSMIVASFGRI